MLFYLDKEQISRLATNTDAYKRGFKYYSEGKADKPTFEESSVTGNAYNVAKVHIRGNFNEYDVDILFDAKGILQKYRCNCDAFGVWRGGCKHVIAALLKLFEMNQESVARSRLSRAAGNLLGEFEKQALEEIDTLLREEDDEAEISNSAHQSDSKVRLVPRICSESDLGPYLLVSVGRTRLYIIKNILEFMTRMENGIEASYGKGFTLVHKKAVFDAESVKLLDFMRSEYENFSTMAKSVNQYYVGTALSGRKLPLSKRGLDDFFNMFSSKSVDVDFHGIEAKSLIFSDEIPRITFNIAKTDSNLEISNSDAEFKTFEGERGRYIALGEHFHNVSTDYYNTLMPLCRTFSSSQTKLQPNRNISTGYAYTPKPETKRITFTKQEFGRLSTFLLPKLKKHGMIDDSLDLSDEMKQFELIKKAFVDVENGSIIIKLMFCYGDTEINSLSVKTAAAFTRDILEEHKTKNLLHRMGFVTASTMDCYKLSGNDLIYDFYKSEQGIALLRKTCEVYATDEFLNKSVRPSPAPSFGLRVDGGLLRVTIDADGFSREELLDIFRSYEMKKRFHRLKDGSFISFEADGENINSVSAAAELISGLALTDNDILNGSADLPKYRAMYAEQILSRNRELAASRDRNFKKLTSEINSYKNLEFEVPQSLENTLRPYQKEGFNWLKVLRYYGFGGVLADDMGLGKTIQIIAVVLADKLEKADKFGPSIVVAPTSLIYNWEKEFNRFAPEIKVLTVAGIAGKRHETIAESLNETELPDVYITTYDMLKRDIDFYSDINFEYIIADEAQNIKNPLTQNAKCVKELKGETRFALTGTPIENSLAELWSIFDFIMPGYLFNSTKFGRHYEMPIIKNNDKERASELRRQIAPFILRRIKRDVLKELPEKIETTLYAEMTEEQQKIYAAYMLQVKGELEGFINSGKYKENQIEILSMLTRLRQICCHPATFVDGYEGGSGKLDITAETVQHYIEGGHRILIFSQFTKMLAILRDMLEENEVEYFYLDGATPSKDRLAMTERFNEGAGQVFLISLKAGGTGLNLTGADTVIHYDPWWNPAVMDQASDRAHRFGQKRTVQVINIVAKDTIEEKIIALQSLKKGLVDLVIQEGANFISKMTEEDIMDLFV